jgi:hypothetical protein
MKFADELLEVFGFAPIKKVEVPVKVKTEKNPRILTCTCGVTVKVSRYVSNSQYVCATCRKNKVL